MPLRPPARLFATAPTLSRPFSTTRPSLLASSPSLSSNPPYGSRPSPPRLPPEQQKVFEELQRTSTGAFSTPNPNLATGKAAAPPPSTPATSSRPRPQVNQSPQSSDAEAAAPATAAAAAQGKAEVAFSARGEGEELHPDIRRGARPEFEGETNPQTGEVGGPKNEPLRWGGKGDWSYNGRVTDF